MPRAPNSTSQAPERFAFLEGMRGVAALYVVFGHLCSMVDPARLIGKPDQSKPWIQMLTGMFAYGHIAVAVFIVISGFSLQLSLFGPGGGRVTSVARFYRRRAQRILPTYYACLAFSLIVALNVTPLLLKRNGEPFPLYLPVTPANVWAHVFMLHNWSTGWMYKINGVLWSIGIESQLYIVFPLLVLGITRIGRPAMLAATTVAALLCLALLPEAPKLYPWYLPLFVLGMSSAHYAYRPNLRIGVLPRLAMWIAAIAAVAGLWACSRDLPLAAEDGLFGAAAAAIMYVLILDPGAQPNAALSGRWVTFVGGFSYSLYLMHHPIEQVLYLLKPHSWGGTHAMIYQFVVALPAILVGSWLFSLVFERPFLPRRDPRRVPVSRTAVVDLSRRDADSEVFGSAQPA